MNIFALYNSPQESARAHCDQHLHKMLVESAQMLSTAAVKFFPPEAHKHFYKPAYQKHPCTIWCCESLENSLWVVSLCIELETIRDELNHPYHASMDIIKYFVDYQDELDIDSYTPFVFAGPAFLKLDNLRYPTIHLKYQEFYRLKSRTWLDSGRKMTYKGRPVPDFMKDSIV